MEVHPPIHPVRQHFHFERYKHCSGKTVTLVEMQQNSKNRTSPDRKNWFIIFSLVIAGEMIFALPFHIARFFRPTLLEVFNLTNTKLGDAIAVYGITAMLSYFPSGLFADRFSARKLMSLSLIATALGGVWLVTLPNQYYLFFIFGFWGVSTILFFWSAMIRATREWGGRFAQGRAFGFLDGGRGLVAAGVASAGVVLLNHFMPVADVQVDPDVRMKAFQTVVWLYIFSTLAAGVLVWFLIPDTRAEDLNRNPLKGIKQVVNFRATWLIALVVVCAYCGYKGLDFYGLYASRVMGMGEVESARFVSWSGFLRPVGAIGAGFIADRLSTKKVIRATFFILVFSYFLLFFLIPTAALYYFILTDLLLTFLAVYALRGVYFALFEETGVNENVTGTTVGVVSFIGFTPDIFFNSVAGRILDADPGMPGFRNFYLLLSVISLAGLAAAILINNKNIKTQYN